MAFFGKYWGSNTNYTAPAYNILESETSLSLIIKKCAVADVPVFVFGKHMPDEWNDELGFYVTENNSIINKFETFIDNYKNYNPRKYIID